MFLSIQFCCYIYNNVKRVYVLICVVSQNHKMDDHLSVKLAKVGEIQVLKGNPSNFYSLKNRIEFFLPERGVFRVGQTLPSE